jgi:N4-gp56 family major capsid protein
MQNFNTSPARIAKYKGEILAHAIPVEVLGITGSQKQIPKNNSDTVIFRRWLPFGAVADSAGESRWIPQANTANYDGSALYVNAQVTAEGVTPAADSLTQKDVTAVLNQYHVLYSVTDKTVDMYEDDIPAEMKKQVGERMGLIREMVRYGVIKAATNKVYGGTGTSRATVNGKLTLNMLRKQSRTLQANHAKRITSILAPSPNIATFPVEASYIVFCHTDLDPDIRDLPGFKHVAEYGSRKVIHEHELGSVENFRFITSPELVPYNNAGALVGSTGLIASGTNVDVYPLIVCGEDAWGSVALRGADSFDITWIPPGQKDKNDPLGQRGFVGSKMYFTSVVLNNAWLSIGEVGSSAL